MLFRSFVFIISISLFAIAAAAQTSSFVYQGKLHDGGFPANGVYQFQFRLYDAETGGGQIGPTVGDITATTTNGVFSVNLDFGIASFSGPARFLEIGLRLNGSGQPYVVLNPRQAVTSTPYAVRSLNAGHSDQSETANTANSAGNADNLGGVAASQYVLTTDPRLNQLPGNYIQNSTSLQSSSNFHISGEGIADKFTAATQFNVGVNRILASSNANLFVGFGTGNGGAIGGLNTFVGNNAGMNTTNGTRNTFTGAGAGIQNTVGNDNSYFGSGSGLTNQAGDNNSFFGADSGSLNTADNNSFFGAGSGKVSTTGANNAFFGFESGLLNKTGAENSFFGSGAGKANIGGDNNSFFGRRAGTANTEGNFNSFFGNGAGQANATGIGNSFFGDSTGLLNNGSNNAFFGKGSGLVNSTGSNNVFLGYTAGVNNTVGSNNTLIGANAQISHEFNSVLNYATAIGAGASVHSSNTIALGREDGSDSVWISGDTYFLGKLHLNDFADNGGGATHLCLGTGQEFNVVAICSSSIRYKEKVENYTRGLDLITKLRPVTFDWKSSGERDLGFIAEEVNAIDPLLNVYRQDGQIEGVKYAQITTALVNAVKEQQAQIEALKAVICAAGLNLSMCEKKQSDKKP